MHKWYRLIAALGFAVVTLVASASGSSPAGADPGFINLPFNQMSPQYEVNGCRYRVMYLAFGSAPVALLRTYNSGCEGSSVAIQSVDGNGRHVTFHPGGGVSTGTDGCGSYEEIAATGPAPGYAIGLIAALPGAPGGPLFNGWRGYSADGLQGQTINAFC